MDQLARGILIYLRFQSGKWKHIEVWSERDAVKLAAADSDQ